MTTENCSEFVIRFQVHNLSKIQTVDMPKLRIINLKVKEWALICGAFQKRFSVSK